MAYRTAEQNRWRKLDFVLGYEVKLSNQHGHTYGQHGACEICEALAGKYPKTFVFEGWHPNCMCYAVPIMPSVAEMREYLDNDMPADAFRGDAVTQPPQSFAEFVTQNKENIQLQNPYWYRHNKDFFSNPKFGFVSGFNGAKLGRKATSNAWLILDEHKEIHDFTNEQKDNFLDIAKHSKFERGTPMSFKQADNGQSNIYKDTDNCAACVLAHEMRIRGYNITALPFNSNENSVSIQLSNNTRIAWLTSKGKTPEFSSKIGGTEKEIISSLEKQTQTIGSRYHIGWDDKLGGGHIITMERTKQGLVFYDPQRNFFISISEIISEMKPNSKLEILRVDRLLINLDLLLSIITDFHKC